MTTRSEVGCTRFASAGANEYARGAMPAGVHRPIALALALALVIECAWGREDADGAEARCVAADRRRAEKGKAGVAGAAYAPYAAEAEARCREAAHGGSREAQAIVAAFDRRAGRNLDVLAAAAAVITPVDARDHEATARLWLQAGEVALQLHRDDEAWRWFERAFELAREPTRRSLLAQRLADRALDTGDIARAATLLHTAVEAADRGGSELPALTARFDVINALLRLGDPRGAETVLATARPLAERHPPQRPAIELAAGDVAALRGHGRTAGAHYARCVTEGKPQSRDFDADVAMRCHTRLGTLALQPPADVARAEAAAAAAAAHAAEAHRGFGADPDRSAELEHLRALIDHVQGRGDLALTRWTLLWSPRSGAAGLLPGWAAPATPRFGAGTRARIALPFAAARLAAGDAAGAEAVLVDAVAAVAALRDSNAVKEARRGLPDGLRAPAEALVRLRLARGDRDGALAIIEQAQRRDFGDRLLSERDDAAGIADAVAPRRDLAALLTAVVRTEAAHERLAAIAVPDRAPPSAPAIVAFWSDAHHLWRIAVPAAGPPAIEQVAERAWLDPRVEAARAAPEGAAAAELGARLFPRAALPAAAAAIVIVPDPALAGLGFAALPVDGAPLVARHPIAIAPSIGLAWAWSARVVAPGGAAIVLGDPTGDLPGAAAEARAVAAALGVAPRLGADANRAALAAGAGAHVLHVAAHAGTIDDQTVLHLAGGDVTIAELIGLGLAPRTAVVASCASAAQRATAMWSSTAAALAAGGAGAVVGALRSLDDATTAAIVDDFYQAGGADDAIGALAVAQQRARARGVPVTSWAFLVVYGAPASPDRM